MTQRQPRPSRIVKTPGVCRGVAHFSGTRLPVCLFYGPYMRGRGQISPEDRALAIRQSSLSDCDIDDAIAYISDKPEEIQDELLRTAGLLHDIQSGMELADANKHISKMYDVAERLLYDEREKNQALVDVIVSLQQEISMMKASR